MKKLLLLFLFITFFVSCSNDWDKINSGIGKKNESKYHTFYWKAMMPNISDEEKVQYNENYDNINRGDIIVFNIDFDGSTRISRVIWLPDEKIKIEGWKVYLYNKSNDNYNLLEEKYIPNEIETKVNLKDSSIEYEIPSDSYFIMWDNRLYSTDSRNCFASCSFKWNSNYLNKKNIVWKVIKGNDNKVDE